MIKHDAWRKNNNNNNNPNAVMQNEKKYVYNITTSETQAC